MTRRTGTLLVTALLVVALLVAGVALPVPYVAQEPGPVSDTLGSIKGKPLITVTGQQTYPTSGRLDLTTVEERDKLTLFGALTGWISKKSAVLPEEVEKTPGQSRADLQREFQRQMEESQQSAISAALHELGLPAQVRVQNLSAGSPSAGKLQPGDVLTSVNGKPVQDAINLRMQIGATPVGGSVRVQFRRGTAPPAEVTIFPRSTNEDGQRRAVIGVLTEEQRPVKVDLQMVSINGQDVGGPSAGLMFALGIYDVLTPGPLTQGRTIAGTGTIDPDGNVGPIGGIQQKLVGAHRAGAGVFLTPATNCAEARQATPSGLRLIRVSTLDDSIKALQSLGQGRSDQPGC